MENRFEEDDKDLTILDRKTGLIWLKNANYFEKIMTWKEAVDACNSLTIAGGGWRLPERFELEGLLDLARHDPALPQGHPFKNVQSFGYWSATTHAVHASRAWAVGMSYGVVYYYFKTGNSFYVWPVR